MTFFALSTAGLLIPLNCMFSGLGVIVDRQAGAMRELLVAPIPRSWIVIGNLLSAVVVTALQVSVLIAVAALRGADFDVARVGWFLAAGLLLTVMMYGLAEMLASRLGDPVEYTGVIPALAIVPFFFAGSLYPITSLPVWLADIAKALPLTHALALFRYGLTDRGPQALHNIWGMQNVGAMAALSLVILAGFAVLSLTSALRVFTKASRS
jgi:ABC-2 type transport system permease protein